MTKNEPIPDFLEYLDKKEELFARLPINFSFFTVRDVRRYDEFNTAKTVLPDNSPEENKVFCRPFYKRISKCY